MKALIAVLALLVSSQSFAVLGDFADANNTYCDTFSTMAKTTQVARQKSHLQKESVLTALHNDFDARRHKEYYCVYQHVIEDVFSHPEDMDVAELKTAVLSSCKPKEVQLIDECYVHHGM